MLTQEVEGERRKVLNPKLVIDYNDIMEGVDRPLSHYVIPRNRGKINFKKNLLSLFGTRSYNPKKQVDEKPQIYRQPEDCLIIQHLRGCLVVTSQRRKEGWKGEKESKKEPL